MVILERLEGVRPNGKDRYVARCPSHADKSPSLSVKVEPDGRVLLHCFAGCDTESVLSAVGLTFRDIMPERIGDFPRQRPALTARDAMECLKREGGIIAIVAADISEGKPVSKTDADRVCEAVGRITAALEFCYGS